MKLRKSNLNWLTAIFCVVALSLASGCDDDAPDYRFRLTVEVDTPEGVKTGSSIIEVEQSLGRAGGSPAGSQIYRKLRGEAVAVDLPGGRTLFALLQSGSDIEWAETIVANVAPKSSGSASKPRFDSALRLKGEVELPRTFPAYAFIEERSAYPLLVTFGDLNDPTSVERVDPDDLAAAFGVGPELSRITVKLTDEPITTAIESRLPWLVELEGSILRQPRSTPIGQLPIEYRVSNVSFIRRDK